MEALGQTEVQSKAVSEEDVVWLSTITLLLIGFAFRGRGFLAATIPFGEDEASWAIRLIEWPLSSHTIRPFGFMAVSKLAAHLLSPSETVLRMMPWLAGMATLLMSPFLAKRLFTSNVARLLFVGAIAMHPGAIDLAKEFKPYSLSLALHTGYLLLGLRYVEKKQWRDLGPLLGLLLVGIFISQDALFAFPALFALLLFEAYRARRLRQLATIVLMACATLAVVGTMYVRVWSRTVSDGDKTADYWGKKYDVFYVQEPGQPSTRLSWTLQRAGEIAALPGMRRESWTERRVTEKAMTELKAVDQGVWEMLALVGVGALFVRRRYHQGLLLLGPLALFVTFNLLGFWPLGAFRTNLFALVYAAGIGAAAIDRTSKRASGWDLVPTGALVILPFLLFAKTSHARKTSSMAGDSAFVQAMRGLVLLREDSPPRKAGLALDNASCAQWRYYLRYHPKLDIHAELNHRFNAQCTKTFDGMLRVVRKRLKKPESRAFFMLTSGKSMDQVETQLPPDLVIDRQSYYGGRDQLVVRVRRKF